MADITSVEKFFPTPNEEYTSTLSATIAAGASVVSVANAAAYTDGDVVVLVVDPKTVNEAVFTGTKASSPDRFVNCKWTEGNVGVGHASGAVVIDYVTATHLAATTKGLLVSHNQDGTLKNKAVTESKLDFTTLKFGNYSTTEVDTGFKWIDGKAIYRRTFTGTITAAAHAVVGTDLIASGAPFSQLIRGFGTWRKNGVEHVVFSGGWSGTNVAAIDWNQSSGKVQILSSSDAARTNAPYHATLEYTKP